MICAFSKLLRNTNFLNISLLLSESVIFGLKREVFKELDRKFLKTTGKHNLAVCGSICGENQFLLIIVPY